MRYHALACDYDGTLAFGGQVAEDTFTSLERFRATGRKLLLVTGRELEELLGIFPHVSLFDWVIAENGALLYHPASRETKQFGDSPSNEFIDALRLRGVEPIAVGHTIVATLHPHETAVLEVIQALGLDMQVIFNKGAVMILPASINKASGLREALKELGLSPHEVVGVGDAENDHAFLSLCECSVAVANALPSVKERVDIVTERDHGAGVRELVDRLIQNDLEDLDVRLIRHQLHVGNRPDGANVRISPYGLNLLIAGPSRNDNAMVCAGLLERLIDAGYQSCVIDPEGDYVALPGAIILGGTNSAPQAAEILQVLKDPSVTVVVNLAGFPLTEQRHFFDELLPKLQEMRACLGRPHWIIVNETHELLRQSRMSGQLAAPRESARMAFVTVHPVRTIRAALETVDLVLAVGMNPQKTLASFADALGIAAPAAQATSLGQGEVLAWPRTGNQETFTFKTMPSKRDRAKTGCP